MENDRIGQLLERADAGAAPRLPADLAARVGRQIQRRSTARRAVAVAVPVLVTCLAVTAWVHLWGGNRATPRAGDRGPALHAMAVDAAQTPEIDLDRRRAQAEQSARVVLGFAVAEESQRQVAMLARQMATPDALAGVDAQVERAALIALTDADDLARNAGGHPPVKEVAAAYRRVIELFPATPSAQVARGRLAENHG